MEDQLILTIDVGSSSVRASLYDRKGSYVSGTAAQLLYCFKATSDGGAEMDADELMELVPRARYSLGPIAGPPTMLRICGGGSTKPQSTAGPAVSCTLATCRPSCSGSAVTLRKPIPARSAGYHPASTFTVGSLGRCGWGPRWPPPQASSIRTIRGGTLRYWRHSL